MTRIGKRVKHLGDPAGIGTVVAEHQHHCEVRMHNSNEPGTRLMLNRVVDEFEVVARASFTYRPGDRDAPQGADAAGPA